MTFADIEGLKYQIRILSSHLAVLPGKFPVVLKIGYFIDFDMLF